VTVAGDEPDPGSGRSAGGTPGSDPTDDPESRTPTSVHDATFCFEYPDERRARLVADVVGNDVGEIDDDRSRTALSWDGRRVTVTVEAADLVALRAAANTWLGLVDVAERTADVAEANR